jgi:ABC-type bacteriocin/lantibiotic exporter with double-glycine peptidase domain
VATAPNKYPNEEQIIENVPFYSQETFQCGPASLSAVFNYWGTKITPEEIARAIYSASARGTLTLDMVLYAEKKGFAARQYKGDLTDIKKNIDSGYPMVVLVDYGFSIYEKSHFMVVLGYNDKGLFVHSGKEKEKFISLKEFLGTWEKTAFWTLLIKPKRNEG